MEFKLDYYKGVMLACDNARAHLYAAKLLTQINYGIANAHLVLAAEEGAKAYAIFDKYKGGHLYKDDFKKFFWSHGFKHASIWKWEYMFVVGLKGFGRLLKHFYDYGYKYLDGKELPEYRKKELIECIAFLEKGDPDTIKLKKWCQKADNSKIQGFYLDYKDNRWLDPKSTTREQYDSSLAVVNKWLNSIFDIEKTLLEDAQ